MIGPTSIVIPLDGLFNRAMPFACDISEAIVHKEIHDWLDRQLGSVVTQ